MDLEIARKKILAGEPMTLDEHKALYDAWRGAREGRASAPREKAATSKAKPVKGATLEQLLDDFGVKPTSADEQLLADFAKDLRPGE